MSNWPFYFALFVLILLINIKVKEKFDGTTIDNIQKSINYGESTFSIENESISKQISNLMKDRNALIQEDSGVRKEIDTCVGKLRDEIEINTVLGINNSTCTTNLNKEIGYTQQCNQNVTNLERDITYLNIQQSNMYAQLVECNWVRINGNRPPPPPNPPISSVGNLVQENKKQEEKGIVYYYIKEKEKCDADHNEAVEGWKRRHPPPPPPPPPRPWWHFWHW
jgi:hypothetical protein